MSLYYCQTCNKFVTNKWAIIDGVHVGCPAAETAEHEDEQEPEHDHYSKAEARRCADCFGDFSNATSTDGDDQ